MNLHLLGCLTLLAILPSPTRAAAHRVAPFEADITIPIGHACMGGGIADAKEILDPLFARGFVLLGDDQPVVVVALDWCQLNNRSYDRWRDVLAAAAGTTRQRVMLATVHQHDAPITDLRAQELLDAAGLKNSMCDPAFHEKAVQATAAALRKSLASPKPVTHVGVGQAAVQQVASNRRVAPQGAAVHWDRTSSDHRFDAEPEGETDPFLKTISLWENDTPVLAWSTYSVHPMSHYGKGQVSADFVGLARARRQADDPGVFQVYFTGCAGDTTAGKYNDGKPEERRLLADRVYDAMVAAWKSTRRTPLAASRFRSAPLNLPVRDDGDFSEAAQRRILSDPNAPRWRRNMAAMGLAWRERAGQPIDVPCLDLGPGVAQFVVLPAEAFVGYQRLAQRLRPDSFVAVAGFGDGAPGYLPTADCWAEGYRDGYCWVTPDSAPHVENALLEALGPQLPRDGVAESTLHVVKRELSEDFCWFHPRAAAIPAAGDGMPAVIVTLQKHLRASDHYSGLYFMRSGNLGRSWTGPTPIPSLDWVKENDGTTRAVADVTPGWHAPTRRLIAIGVQVWYDAQGRQREDKSPTAYATFDPKTNAWSTWKTLRLPDDNKFAIARNGCGQWLVEPDGSLLIPIYFAGGANEPTRATVLKCKFDGQTLTYATHGDELNLTTDIGRGLAEPSIVRFKDRYYLTIRSDARGYVTSGADGLHFDPLTPWAFDDGAELGSYNTQQHWLASPTGLYLSYTRRGLGNDHIMRHRAPLLMARVDPQTKRLLRATERTLIPERGVPLGNFGASAITPDESWVTDAEYIMSPRRDSRGADGSVFVARVRWEAERK